MLIVFAMVCVVCEAIFTAMEVALGAVSRARVRALLEDESARGNPAESAHLRSRATRLLHLLERPERLTLAFIIVTSLALWTAGALLTWQSLAQNWPIWALPLALVGVLFVAEALPLLVAARNPEAIALRCVRLVERSVRLLLPLIWLLGGLGKAVARLFGATPLSTPQVTQNELREALAVAEDEGVIQSEERAMLESAMSFREKTVREVMTPRIDIVGIPALMPLRAVLDIAMREGHSRLPVYQSSMDNIIGIIATKDLLPHLRPGAGGDTLSARDVVRPAFYVPSEKRIASALDDLRRQRTLMAVIVDSDGGTAGLVTLEDLLEEIVGEIEDEYDEDEAPLRVVDDENQVNDNQVNNEAGETPPRSMHAIVAQGSKTVREAERFWNQSFGEGLVLLAPTSLQSRAENARDAASETRNESNRSDNSRSDNARETAGIEAAREALSLAALSLQLFDGVPSVGDSTRAGSVFSTLIERQNVGTSQALADVELRIITMNGPRIEEVQLQKQNSEDGIEELELRK